MIEIRKSTLKISLVSVLLLPIMSFSANAACVQPPTDMVSWWDGDVVSGVVVSDIQGLNHGTLMNGATTVPGKVGQAFNFDGVDDYIDVPDSSNLDITGEITIDFWVKLSGNTSNSHSTLLAKQSDNPVQSNREPYSVTVGQGVIGWSVWRSMTPAWFAVTHPISWAEDEWHHVAVTRKIEPLKHVLGIYIDGILVESSNTTAFSIGTSNQPLRVGSGNGGNFNGSIDEIEIFNRALTAPEIQSIYNAGSAGKCTPQHGQICGTKFRDDDGDGTQDGAEPGLLGWIIQVKDSDQIIVGSNITDQDGNYCITLRTGGPYSVSEVSQGGWQQTYPVGGEHSNISVTSGAALIGKDFGNKPEDVNREEHYKCYEVENEAFKPRLVELKDQFGNQNALVNKARWLCTPVNKNNEGIINPANHLVCYTIRSHSVNKMVEIENQFGTQRLLVRNAETLCVPSTKRVFGQICGTKFRDDNGDGVQGYGEPGLPSWTIQAQVGTTTPYMAITDLDGNYCINVPEGTYTVTEIIPTNTVPGWKQTYPSKGMHSETVAYGQVVSNVNFGNQPKEDYARTTRIPVHNPGVIGAASPSLPDSPDGGSISITKKHSPSRFSTGSKGTFMIKVKNKGKKLAKGMLRVVDHMPVGLSVKSGKFIADLWTCEGGMVSGSGQDVTCEFNKTLRKNRWSAIKLNAFIAPESQFPAAVNVVKNCATVSVQDAAGVVAAGSKVCDTVRIKHVESSGASSIPIVPNPATPPNVSIEKKHSPSRFSTGSKGSFSIKVQNQGNALAKGMLRVVDHMPGGLSVKTGTFRAGSWSCKGGMIASIGQNVTCAYNRTLGKHSRATLHLNARVAPKGRFPAGVNEVENCATASVQGAAGVLATGPKVCDKIKIRHMKSIDVLNLPIGIGIGGGGGATAPVRKTPGAVR